MLDRTFRPLGFSSLLLALGACVGHIGDGPAEVGAIESPLCKGDAAAPGPSPIRRMTRFEYNSTVRDLLGDTTRPADMFAAEEEALGFNNNAAALVVSPLLAEKYMLAAEDVARRATEDVAGLTGCDPDGPARERHGCARVFINAFGKRAFRRPLTSAEQAELHALFEEGAKLEKGAALGFRSGISAVLEAMLQSPHFLYRVELGEGMAPLDGGSVVPVSSWEMASRLSYILWGSMPDEALFVAAEADELRTREQIEAQARRMLASDKARDAVAMFHEQWLDYDRISNVGKDATLFPEWSSAIGAMMREEARAFIDHVVFDGGGDLDTLLRASYTYASPALAAFYGGDAHGAAGDAPTRVDFDPEERAGILTMGALLAYNAHSNQTSPVHRGKLVREAFLCDVLLPPPADVKFELPMPDPSSTARERFAEHSAGTCANCHRLMDPLGFGFEGFDALGRHRAEENGAPVDASGEIVDSDVDGAFVGARGLADRLAESAEVKACYAKMWFRYAYGRGETGEDACTLERVGDVFEASGGDVRELLVALTQTDAFLYRAAPPAGGE